MKKVFVVIEGDVGEGRSWVSAVFAKESLAKEFIVQRQAELVEDEMDEMFTLRYIVEDLIEE